jgi:replication factor A1
MFGLTYDDIVEKIVKEKGISKEEIAEKVDEKIKQLSDLISKEGAAQIIANQLGVKVVENVGDKKFKINQLPKGVSSVNALGKVTQISEIRTFNRNGKEGKVVNFTIGDETGSIRIVVWDEKIIRQVEEGEVEEGSILQLRNAYSKINNGRNELHLGGRAQVEINPKGISIGEVVKTEVFEKPTAEGRRISDLKEGMFAELKGTIVQLFEPRHYLACPECNRKVIPEGNGHKCNSHGEVGAKKSPIVNMFFDDGTSNIRVVCFSNQVEQLFGKPPAEVADADVTAFDALKKDVLGKQLTISGRVNRNTMMDRLEFMASNIKDVNPVEMVKAYE